MVQIDPEKSGSSYTNTVSINFGWNIFDGGQNRNLYKSSKADSKSEDYSYKNLENIFTYIRSLIATYCKARMLFWY